MKLLIFLLAAPLAAVEPATLDAIERIESNCQARVIGDNGLACGSYQLHPIMVREVNRINKLNGDARRFKLVDRFSRSKSRAMCLVFLEHQEKRYVRKYGVKPSEELLACSWNSGSAFKPANKSYRNKVKKELEK